jgi:hypothetical protein
MPSEPENPFHAILDLVTGKTLAFIGTGLMFVGPIIANAAFDALGKPGILWLMGIQSGIAIIVALSLLKRNSKLTQKLDSLEKPKKPTRQIRSTFGSDETDRIVLEEFGPVITGSGVKMLQIIAHTPKGVISEVDLKQKAAGIPPLEFDHFHTVFAGAGIWEKKWNHLGGGSVLEYSLTPKGIALVVSNGLTKMIVGNETRISIDAS